MWKKLSNWKDLWPAPLCIGLGVLFLLAGLEGTAWMLLLGIVSILWSLYILIRQIGSRIAILRSPDYPAMEEDLSQAERFLDGRVLLGKTWLFSSYSGKMFRCRSLRIGEEKVYRPARGSAYAKLMARVDGERDFVLASYYYDEAHISQVKALREALELRRP